MTTKPQQISKSKYVMLIATILVMIGLFVYIRESGFGAILENVDLLKSKILSLGNFGPVVIILTMAIAIVLSPIPSAPIALASGALYGHTWGTLYVIVGSTAGAIIAFSFARLFGYSILQHHFAKILNPNWVGSQNTVMGIVFFSRLMPFISFDIVSYAAGLTTLTFGRFTIATIAGITPASFILAHFGHELSSTDSLRVAFAVLLLGLLAAVPICYRWYKAKKSPSSD